MQSSTALNEPSAETEIEMFRKMMLIKLCDERLIEIIRAGRMRSPYYSPRGQEAISAAISVNLRPDDYVVTIYRGIHDHLAKGVPLKALFAEYAGRQAGSCKGKGGPMHITHPACGVMVTTGIVGSGNPIANGLAWASVIRGDGRVCVSNFGDGASNIGSFHEALNLASLWKLPVVFVCQNNGYGEHTRFDLGTAVANIADRAASYDMPGVTVDGNDARAVWRAAHEAIMRARTGGGPTLLEAKTFRFNGHILGDPGEYIPKQVMADAKLRDPVPLYRQSLIERGIADENLLQRMVRELTQEISDAVDFALDAPWPDDQELAKDVYREEIAL
jgi:TPP-dependent pyruvate/acetoin dehydrogenase alpha subunit